MMQTKNGAGFVFLGEGGFTRPDGTTLDLTTPSQESKGSSLSKTNSEYPIDRAVGA